MELAMRPDGGTRLPKPGDVSLCMHCGAINQIDLAGALQPTVLETLPLPEEAKQYLRDIQRKIRATSALN